MKKRFVSIMMAITVIFSSVGSNNFIIYADDFSNEEDMSLDDGADITVDTEEPENTNSQLEETDISEEVSDDENNPDITIEDDSEEDESEEDLEFSGSDELFTDSDEPEVFSAGTQNSSCTPEYDVWLSDTIVSGLKMNGTTYGNSMYEIFKEMQEPIYEELGELILGDVPMMSISSVWNNVIKREFYTNQKLIYETLLVEYIKYENKTNAEQFDTTQIDRTNAYLIKIFNELADGGPQDWASEQFMNMSVDEAIKSFENVQCMKDTIRRTKDISKNVKEFITFNANLLALEDAKREKVQLIKNARDACASMGNSNYDFITACNEIIEEIEKVDIDLHSYVLTQSANTAMKAVIDKVWSDLCEKNIVLKSIDWGADAMDILFNTSDAASNNLKLSILYTMDCYFKMGLSNAATSYLSHPTDKEAALTFNSCFDGYVNFQIYGNHTAKSWISSVTDDGALNHAFTYIFCREALKSAEELKTLCDSQNKTRNQILNILDKYPDIYSNLYMKDEYKQALSVPVTPTPAIDPKDYKISEGLTSPNPQVDGGKCGDAAYWKLFEDGTLIIYGKGSFWKNNYKLNGDKIRKVEILNGITEMCEDSFKDLEGLEKITIPEGVTKIRKNAFYGCGQLKSINIPKSVVEIGDYAFEGCSSLKDIILPQKVTSIGRGGFSGCSEFKSITLPEGLTDIAGNTFSGCFNLENITIPKSVINIEDGAFWGCNSLKSITIPEGIVKIDTNVFVMCFGLENIVLPESVTRIEGDAFYSCKNLKNIIIPDSVVEISETAFWDCINLSIHGHTGSYAEKYAKENNIPFINLDGKKDDVTVTPAVKPTVKPTATPQKPSTKPATREPAVLKLNVTAVTLQRKQSTTGLKITGMAKWDSVASWKSSNTKIVKVSKTGKLTAQNKTGKATVTVTLKSGLSKKVTVKVQKAPVGTIKIAGLKKAVTLAKGKTLQLKPVRQPFTCREKITYTSSNKKVVSVNSKGKIKALKPGKAKITVKSGKKKVVITVTVKKK